MTSASRVSRVESKRLAPAICSELLRYQPGNNAGYAPEWPGPLVMSENGFRVDYSRLPIDMYAEVKRGHIHTTLSLSTLQLTDENGDRVATTSRASERRGRNVVGNYHINTVIYTVRYVQTVDAAITAGGADMWTLPCRKDALHLPFLCNEHLMGVKAARGVPEKVHDFRSIAKDQLILQLSVQCGCYGNGMDLPPPCNPYLLSGKFFRENIVSAVARIRREAPGAKLGPFEFEIVKERPRLEVEAKQATTPSTTKCDEETARLEAEGK